MSRIAKFTLLLLTVTSVALLPNAARAASAPVNSRVPGSSCAPNTAGSYLPADPTVSTTAFGSAAPASYEVGMPTGAHVGAAPKAAILIVHGGGWSRVGPGTVEFMRTEANRWRNRGWMTVTIDYRACDKSFADVLWFMTKLRQMQPVLPVCAFGESAGAHLVLLLAGVRPDLACVASMAAPTNLTTLPTQAAWDPIKQSFTTEGSRQAYYAAEAAFRSYLPYASPQRYVRKVRARVLVASASNDVLVPVQQTIGYARALRAARPSNYVDSLVLDPGPVQFIHANVSQASHDALQLRIDALVAPVVAGR